MNEQLLIEVNQKLDMVLGMFGQKKSKIKPTKRKQIDTIKARIIKQTLSK